jgi:hypothetical protein
MKMMIDPIEVLKEISQFAYSEHEIFFALDEDENYVVHDYTGEECSVHDVVALYNRALLEIMKMADDCIFSNEIRDEN